jgi:hypothetical protein
VAKVDWTYEVAPAGAPATGLEEYLVEDERGELVGKVQTLLRHGGDRFVAVERGTPPFSHDVRLVPWERVQGVDQSDLTVRLELDAAAFAELPALDPDLGIENEPADLVRAPELPAELLQPVEPGPAGPTDRTAFATAFAVGMAGVFSVLVAVALTSIADSPGWLALFALPVVLLGLAGFLAYRAWREPFERR